MPNNTVRLHRGFTVTIFEGVAQSGERCELDFFAAQFNFHLAIGRGPAAEFDNISSRYTPVFGRLQAVFIYCKCISGDCSFEFFATDLDCFFVATGWSAKA